MSSLTCLKLIDKLLVLLLKLKYSVFSYFRRAPSKNC